MRRIIEGLNMTIDGVCDHTVGLPDKEIHKHYTDLLNEADTILYGRITYQLMEYWKPFIQNPTGKESMDAFAVAIDKIQKVVFTNTLTNLQWDTALISNLSLKDKILELKQQSEKDILVGSRSIIIQLMDLNLIDELQLCIQPVVATKGLPFFEGLKQRVVFNLVNSKIFNTGSVVLYYQPNYEIKK